MAAAATKAMVTACARFGSSGSVPEINARTARMT
jgi:hypothetical protein